MEVVVVLVVVVGVESERRGTGQTECFEVT